MDKPLIVGIDPGKKGALAVYDAVRHRVVEITDMVLDSRGWVDPAPLVDTLELVAPRVARCVIEANQSRPGNAAQSMFSFGDSTGVVRAAVVALGLEPHYTSPAIWKPTLGLDDTEDQSREWVYKWFPHQLPWFFRPRSRDMSHDRCEAVALAFFGRRLVRGVTTYPQEELCQILRDKLSKTPESCLTKQVRSSRSWKRRATR